MTDREQVRSLVAQAEAQLGAVDVLFNNTGSFRAIGALWEVDPEAWWEDVTINVRGPMNCCQAVLPGMMRRDRGVIINMNGGGGVGASGYECSKRAIRRCTEVLAAELQTSGSRVCVFGMGPGFVRTEMTELHVSTEAGRKWCAGSGEAFARHEDRSPFDCARASVKLLQIARPELSGRHFEPDTNFQEF